MKIQARDLRYGQISWTSALVSGLRLALEKAQREKVLHFQYMEERFPINFAEMLLEHLTREFNLQRREMKG